MPAAVPRGQHPARTWPLRRPPISPRARSSRPPSILSSHHSLHSSAARRVCKEKCLHTHERASTLSSQVAAAVIAPRGNSEASLEMSRVCVFTVLARLYCMFNISFRGHTCGRKSERVAVQDCLFALASKRAPFDALGHRPDSRAVPAAEPARPRRDRPRPATRAACRSDRGNGSTEPHRQRLSTRRCGMAARFPVHPSWNGGSRRPASAAAPP